ncbi:MAG: ISAzo13 family transposase [Thiolinea sp.]
MDTKTIESVAAKYQALQPFLTERSRRLWAATEAKFLGHGGKAAVSKATGLSRLTINKGLAELESEADEISPVSIRRQGGGKKRLVDQSPELLERLKVLVEDSTRGDPEIPLLWTCKSTRTLAAELSRLGYPIGRQKVSELLADLGYSLQGNRKIREGSSHPDRDHQFRYLNARVRLFQRHGQPVISVDTKKKELIGNYSNKGREWLPKGKPRQTNSHDFGKNRVNPYGVYDQTANEGWVSVGTDHDTAEFAVESIRRWWKKMGSRLYPQAGSLLVTADCGGSNGYRVRLWKFALQAFATETGLRISVSHFFPGTSKWNKIEHRMFCHISTNWRGQPLTSHEVVVNLIGNTTTTQGLSITAELDTNNYPKGKKVSDGDFGAINIRRANFHGDWNYKISPECTS